MVCSPTLSVLRGPRLATYRSVESKQAIPREERCTRCLLLSDGVVAPVVFCSRDGELQAVTPTARGLLAQFFVLTAEGNRLLPELWMLLERTALGDAAEWRVSTQSRSVLGCIRYEAGPSGYLILMREVQGKSSTVLEGLHRLRVETTHRLVACVAHDLRGSVASIVYGADVLESSDGHVGLHAFRDTIGDISHASRRLQLTLDGLLDYVRLGPTISVPVSINEIMNRAQGILHSFYRDGLHRVRLELSSGADWVRGNPIVIEQIFVNLLLHAVERSGAPCLVTISSSISTSGGHSYLYLRIADDGPVLSEGQWNAVFSMDARDELGAFNGSLALVDARAAAESQGGRLLLESTQVGAAFAVFLPKSEGVRCDF